MAKTKKQDDVILDEVAKEEQPIEETVAEVEELVEEVKEEPQVVTLAQRNKSRQ
jgi:hypothetical protein